MLCDNCAANTDDGRPVDKREADFSAPKHDVADSAHGPRDNILPILRSSTDHWCFDVVSDIDIETSSGGTAAELTRKLIVLDSLHMQRGAWSRIRQSTICQLLQKSHPVLCWQPPETMTVQSATARIRMTSTCHQALCCCR